MSERGPAKVAEFHVARRSFNGIRNVATERDLSFPDALRYVIDTGLRALAGRVGDICPRCGWPDD